MGEYRINEDGSVTRNTNNVKPSIPSNGNGGNGRKTFLFIITIIAIIAVWFIGKNIYDENSYITTNPASLSCEHSGGSYTVYVKSNRSWDISTYTDNWCTLSKDKNADAVRVKVGPNNSSESRQDYFVVLANGKTCRVDIRQKGKPYLRVSSSLITAGGDGGVFNISVASSEEWKISRFPSDWVQVSKNSNGLTLTVQANRGVFSWNYRSTSIIIESASNKETITINQDKTTEFLNISDEAPKFKKESSYQTLTIKANPDWSIGTYPSNWVSLYRNGDLLRISVGYHNGVKKRTTFFTVKSGSTTRRVNITQYGSDGWDEVDDWLNSLGD